MSPTRVQPVCTGGWTCYTNPRMIFPSSSGQEVSQQHFAEDALTTRCLLRMFPQPSPHCSGAVLGAVTLRSLPSGPGHRQVGRQRYVFLLPRCFLFFCLSHSIVLVQKRLPEPLACLANLAVSQIPRGGVPNRLQQISPM